MNVRRRADDPGDLDFRGLRDLRSPPPDYAMVGPGHVIVSGTALALGAVVGSGVAVTMGAPGLGGLCHFVRPHLPRGRAPTAHFAAPAIAALLRAFRDRGYEPDLIEVGLYGAATPPDARPAQARLAADNAAAALEVLARRGMRPTERDTGGRRARKLMFFTASGDVAVYKTASVRAGDWFPPLPEEGP